MRKRSLLAALNPCVLVHQTNENTLETNPPCDTDVFLESKQTTLFKYKLVQGTDDDDDDDDDNDDDNDDDDSQTEKLLNSMSNLHPFLGFQEASIRSIFNFQLTSIRMIWLFPFDFRFVCRIQCFILGVYFGWVLAKW